MKSEYKKFASLLALFVTIGAGCQDLVKREDADQITNAPIISKSEALVPAETALAAKIEPVDESMAALPCLQFKFKDGFKNWLDSYEKLEKEAVRSAVQINLPENPEQELIDALKKVITDDLLQTSICAIHKELGVYSWAAEYPETSVVYTYNKPRYEKLTVHEKARSLDGSNYTTSTDLNQMGFPTCLPKKITNTELIWFCGSPFENWKQVHVNRILGNMVQISCERKKDGKDVAVGAGCLVPTPK